MPTTAEKFETLIAKARALPEARLQAVVAALEEIAEEPYQLSADELSILLPALEDALRGEHLTDAESDAILNTSWA